MGRREDRAARIAARAERSEMRKRREARKAAQSFAMGGVVPPPADPKGTEDALALYDRHGKPIQGDAVRNQWQGCAAFLVCGGPSLKKLDLSFLKDRGVMSLGVNNVAGYAPVRAWCFSDPPEKFHHGIFFDPAIIKFVPKPKLGVKSKNRVRAKLPDGRFQWTARHVCSCPSVFAYEREGKFYPDKFFQTPFASWGVSHKHQEMRSREKVLFTFFIGLRLLHYLGVRRVYLLGVDFHMDATHGYAFGQDRTTGAQASNNNSYRVATNMLQELRPHLQAAGVEVYQTNKDSALRVFDHVQLTTAIEDCRGLVPKEPWPEAAFQGWYEKKGADGLQPLAQPTTDERGED